MRFQAALHGVDLDAAAKDKAGAPQSAKEQRMPIFGSPDDYAELSPEERQKMTDKMMGKWKNWAENKPL